MNLLTSSSGQPAVPPNSHSPSRSDYPPPPYFPLEMPPPSPSSRPPSDAYGFSTSIRFGPLGNGSPSVPQGLPPMSLRGSPPPASLIQNLTPTTAAAQTRPSNPEKRYAFPSFTRPICSTCHVNCVSVREGNINFCERCFQDALRRRGKNESPKTHRPTCGFCRVNYVNVREGETSYCERCWKEALRRRGV